MRNPLRTSVLCGLGCIFSGAFAQPHMELKNQVFWLHQQTLIPESERPAAPAGSEGILRITLRNLSANASLTFQPQQFLMPNQTYVPGSASMRHLAEFSFDHGKTYAKEPVFRTVQWPIGKTFVLRRIKIPPEEYTDVRWNIQSLPPGGVVVLDIKFRVK